MNGAAIWSAVAATFAALSSFMIMLIQRRNLLESVRPELVLTGWNKTLVQFADNKLYEVLTFNTIRNVGRGAALQVYFFSDPEVSGTPCVSSFSTILIPIVASNDTMAIDGKITLYWNNVKEEANGARIIHITINMYCWDTSGMRHETQYMLTAYKNMVGGNDDIAPGVYLASRRRNVVSPWQHRFTTLRNKTVQLWNKGTSAVKTKTVEWHNRAITTVKANALNVRHKHIPTIKIRAVHLWNEAKSAVKLKAVQLWNKLRRKSH